MGEGVGDGGGDERGGGFVVGGDFRAGVEKKGLVPLLLAFCAQMLF